MYATPTPAVPPFRSRIGCDARSGYYAVPHRYRLHLSPSCPDSLEIAVTHSLLGLEDTLPVTLLPAVPDTPDGGHLALRSLYAASAHQHTGPAVAPVLSDNWTGRIVSTHARDIQRDLARRFGGGAEDLYPCGTEDAVRAVGRLCDGITAAARLAGGTGTGDEERATVLATLFEALGSLETRVGEGPFVLGERSTAADVRLWVALVRLDTVHRHHLDAATVHRLTDHPRLWAYARRLAALPAFGGHLDLDGIARRHHARCKGAEAAGAAVQIVDWAACLRPRSGQASR